MHAYNRMNTCNLIVVVKHTIFLAGLDKVTNFKCAGEAYSRVVYPTAPVGGDSKVSQTCIDNTNVCYMHGSSSASGGDGSLCLPGFDTFTSKGMTYCQPGTVENKTLG